MGQTVVSLGGRIVSAVHVCYAAPSAWDVRDEDGGYLHFKYRYGKATVFEDTDPRASRDDRQLTVRDVLTVRDSLDGYCTLAEFCDWMGYTLELREPYTPLPDPNSGYEPSDPPPWAAEDDVKAPDASVPVRAQVLRDAEALIVGDRETEYGDPYDNLLRIANYWNNYLYDAVGATDLLGPRDVALMMVLMKVAREAAGHKRDSVVDMAGYAALAGEVASRRRNSVNGSDSRSL